MEYIDFIKSEIIRLDKKRVDAQLALNNWDCRNIKVVDGKKIGLEELQTSLFKINIIINYLGSFIGMITCAPELKKESE
jgi:hypothetical protein